MSVDVPTVKPCLKSTLSRSNYYSGLIFRLIQAVVGVLINPHHTIYP